MINLYAPESYQQATEEAKAKICNGCGPQGWKYDFIPDTIWGLSICECCNIHDWMYHEGATIEEKEEADRVYLNNILRLIEAHTKYRFVKWLRRRRAFKYYMAVATFGGPAFWAGKNSAKDEMEVA